ncbi:hypothetical protein K4F52_009007 [Lecanicillium sp. MT-2017a]|nr:hypothetical protein K4F52_009007 [Lecanicillium sp. MT-2017a]
MVADQAIEALGHAASGSAGTAVSTAALAPLDLVTTRLKVQRQLEDQEHYDGLLDAFRSIVKQEGVGGLYSGLGTDVAKSVIDSFLFFGFYNYLRQRSRRPGLLQELAYGSLAGAAAKAFTTPLSNVVTRKQTAASSDESLSEILADMRKQGGLKALWAGYSATLVLTINPSLTFLLNRRLAARIIPALEEEDVPVAWVAFLLAAFSKAAATAITYPFQTGKTRLQLPAEDEETGEKPDEKKKLQRKTLMQKILDALDKTIFGVIVNIVRIEGIRALYDGVQGELLKGFFSHGITMLTKGFFHRLVIKMWLMAQRNRQLRLQTK